MSETNPPPRAALRAPTRKMGTLLVEAGMLSSTQLKRVLQAQRQTGERLGEAAVRLGAVDECGVARALARQLGLPFEAGPLEAEDTATQEVHGSFARQRRLLPLRRKGRFLQVAMEDPLDLGTLNDLQFQIGHRVGVVVTTRSALRQGLDRFYADEVSTLAQDLPDPVVPSPLPPPGAAPGGPIAQLVDLLLRRAVERGASDLHVEQRPGDLVVRERIDGVLRPVTELPGAARTSLLSRIKILAGMDITVKRRPQDGGFPFRWDHRTLSIRVSTLPVEGGEKAVLRFLDPRSAPANLQALGFSLDDLSRVRRLVKGGRGVVLAAGPTGSGKSSTLFGAIGELNRVELNVVTLEDPIEYRLEGVNQVQVNPRSGLTFPSALRSVLRQDPDVIMIGEIRDRETAEIAMAAAVTGHLVLSTVHTMDAPSGITRLLQMGVTPHLVAGGLTGIVAQRLIRRICKSCGGRPKGCPSCYEGYRGRTGVFQVLAVTESLRDLIGRGADIRELRQRAEFGGMGTMADDARRKVAEGVTTSHEVARVLREDPGETLPCRHCGGGLPTEGNGCPHCGLARLQPCACGRALKSNWRFCPICLRKVSPLS